MYVQLRRTKSGSPFIEDDVLETTLRAEWIAEAADGHEEEEEVGDEVANNGEFGDDDTVDDEDLFGFGSAYSSSDDDIRDPEFEGEDLEWFGDDDDDLDLDDQIDVIEVYDEDGELVGTYTAAEFEKIRGQKSA